MITIQTVYLDVYFLINFSIDGIALYFAAAFTKIPSSARRVLICAGVGALTACLSVVAGGGFATALILSLIHFAITVCFLSCGISIARRLKVLFAYLFFQIVIGGIAHLSYGFIDRRLSGTLSNMVSEPENRKLLILSLIILLSVGAFKSLVSFFSNRATSYSVDVELCINGKSTRTQAFVDTGNLVKDPMDSTPVLFVKQNVLCELIPNIKEFVKTPDATDLNLRRRLRFIPTSKDGKTVLYIGLKLDKVSVRNGEKYEPINITVAVDKEGGSYDGCYALMPSSALDNVF